MSVQSASVSPLSSASPTRNLAQRLIRTDGIFTVPTALAFVAFAPRIASLFGAGSAEPLAILGIVFVPYGLWLLYVSRRAVAPRLTRILATANAVWAVATLDIAVSNVFGLSGVGREIMAIQAVVVGLFAVAQFVAARRA